MPRRDRQRPDYSLVRDALRYRKLVGRQPGPTPERQVPASPQQPAQQRQPGPQPARPPARPR